MANHFSPLRYPGGKTCIFPSIDNLVKKNNIRPTIYVEPFAGGAGVALSMLFLERVESIVINDLDRAIYSFWRSAIFETEKFIDKIQKTRVNVSEWYRQKEIYENKKSRIFDLGFATFYLNRTNRSGIMNGGPIGGIDQTGKWKIDARYNKQNLIERVENLSKYKNRIIVCRIDGIKLAQKFLKQKNTIIYLDPPYYEKGSSLYMNHYKNEDHKALSNCLNKAKKGNWILTYDNNKAIRDLYRDRRRKEFSISYRASEVRRGKELLILSDAFIF